MRRSHSLAPWRAMTCALCLLGLSWLSSCDDEAPNGASGGLVDQDAEGDAAADLAADMSADLAGDAAEDAAQDLMGDDDALTTDQGPDLPEGCQGDQDCDNGRYCDGVERCFDGACVAVSVRPCGDLNECTRGACNEETDQCDYTVDDALCAPGQRCDPKAGCFLPSQCGQDSDCDDGLICNGEETCDLAAGRCAPGLPPDCDDAIDCTVDVCIEEIGGCENQPEHQLCLPNELCNVQLGCQERPPCANDDDCDDALFCNGVETCDIGSGLCVAGALPTRSDSLDCTVDNCSNELAMVTHTPNPARCSDGLFCNGAEVCHPVDGCVAGVPPALSDGVSCTTDRCDEEADFIEHIPDAAACDDGLFCNGEEICHPVDGCQPGEPVALNDGVGCTVDSCDEIGRQVVHIPTSSLCDDDLFCNGEERCDALQGCVRGPAPTTEDNLDCTQGACDEELDRIVQTPSHERCADGLFCNGAEVCDLTRGCVAGAAPVVDDGIACTDDACDEDTNAIIHAPVHARCDNALFCDGAELCDLARGCVAGAAPVLEDGVDCTRGSCDEANDRVVQTPDSGLCDDGLFCNGAEVCDAARGCQPGAAPALEDGVACTQGRCDEASDRIIQTPNDAMCADGLFCNGAEVCDLTRGCLAGAAPALNDNIACTADSCDEARDLIVHAPNDALCDNALFCDGAEVCDVARGCVAGAPPVLEDGVDCTRGSCDEANDRIVQTPDDAICDDGLFCNGAEVCDAVRGCQAGAAPVLNDNIPCTADSCDEVNDRVVHAPNNALCSNNNACDGAEVCQVGVGCQSGAPPAMGQVCGANPRQICLAQSCAQSECGDGFHDPGNDEACDDGDDDDNNECRNDCTINQGVTLDYDGTFGLLPDLSYTCTVFGVITVIQYRFTSFLFQEAGNQLVVTGQPPNQTPAVVMTGALPAGRSFTVSQVVPGTCTETYTLTGQFAVGNNNRWDGTFTRTLQGSCFECVGGSSPVRGTRQ